MKAQFLKAAGFPNTKAGEKAFMEKYPTEDAFFNAHPQFKQMRKGGSVYPTQPTMDEFFSFGMVPMGPAAFYAGGGQLPIAQEGRDFVQGPYGNWIPNPDRGSYRRSIRPMPARTRPLPNLGVKDELRRMIETDMGRDFQSAVEFDNEMIQRSQVPAYDPYATNYPEEVTASDVFTPSGADRHSMLYYNNEPYEEGFRMHASMNAPRLPADETFYEGDTPGDVMLKYEEGVADRTKKKAKTKKKKGGTAITQYQGEDVGQGRWGQVKEFIQNNNMQNMFTEAADQFQFQIGGAQDQYGYMGNPYNEMAMNAFNQVSDPGVGGYFLGSLGSLFADANPYMKRRSKSKWTPYDNMKCGGSKLRKFQTQGEVTEESTTPSWEDFQTGYGDHMTKWMDEYFKGRNAHSANGYYNPYGGGYGYGYGYPSRPGGAPVASWYPGGMGGYGYGYGARSTMDWRHRNVGPQVDWGAIDWSKVDPTTFRMQTDKFVDRTRPWGRTTKYKGYIDFGAGQGAPGTPDLQIDPTTGAMTPTAGKAPRIPRERRRRTAQDQTVPPQTEDQYDQMTKDLDPNYRQNVRSQRRDERRAGKPEGESKWKNFWAKQGQRDSRGAGAFGDRQPQFDINNLPSGPSRTPSPGSPQAGGPPMGFDPTMSSIDQMMNMINGQPDQWWQPGNFTGTQPGTMEHYMQSGVPEDPRKRRRGRRLTREMKRTPAGYARYDDLQSYNRPANTGWWGRNFGYHPNPEYVPPKPPVPPPTKDEILADMGFKLGGEVNMTEKQIEEFIAAGGQVEYLD